MMSSDHNMRQTDQTGGLHHREAASVAINIHNDSNGNGSNGIRNSASSALPPPQATARKRRPMAMNFWDRRTNMNGNYYPVDYGNYAKYGKKRVKRNAFSRILRSNASMGTICTLSFILGFLWMHYFTSRNDDGAPVPRPQTSSSRQWKPRSIETPYNPYANLRQPDDARRQRQQQLQPRQPNELLIPRFDTRRYVDMWEKNARDAADALQRQHGRKHPQSIALEGWNFPLAFRGGFPVASRLYGPIKNVDADYGPLTYHSLRNEAVFARVIPQEGTDDGESDVVLGAFDPESIEPEQDLRRRNRRKKKTPGSYPVLDASTGIKIFREDASIDELRNYFDDDTVAVRPRANDGNTNKPRACKRTEFSTFYFPTCNHFHERDFSRAYDDPSVLVRQRPENEMKLKYLSHGYYRDVWLVEDAPWIWPPRYVQEEKERMSSSSRNQKKYGVENESQASEMVAKSYRTAVFKTLQMKHDFSDEHFQEIQLEAVIMERLTKSPRIMDVYGHCGFSTSVEVVPIEFEEAAVPGEGYETRENVEKANEKEVRPKNAFTADEKLGYALEMAESLADLHGFPEGIIVHDDVQLCQWLRTPDGRLKLGDFNRATIMQWDALRGEYCKFNNGEAFANYRAPEEFAAKNLNEQIDVFSFGNNIYGMLTGLWNFYDTDDDSVVQKKLIDGDLPYVDPRYAERSFAEKMLVELMYKCWKYDPDERISIFEAVDFLRKAVAENKARGE